MGSDVTSDETFEKGLDGVMMIGNGVRVGEDDCEVMRMRDGGPVMSARGRESGRSSSTGWRGWCWGWCTPGHGTPGARPGG